MARYFEDWKPRPKSKQANNMTYDEQVQLLFHWETINWRDEVEQENVTILV